MPPIFFLLPPYLLYFLLLPSCLQLFSCFLCFTYLLAVSGTRCICCNLLAVSGTLCICCLFSHSVSSTFRHVSDCLPTALQLERPQNKRWWPGAVGGGRWIHLVQGNRLLPHQRKVLERLSNYQLLIMS